MYIHSIIQLDVCVQAENNITLRWHTPTFGSKKIMSTCFETVYFPLHSSWFCFIPLHSSSFSSSCSNSSPFLFNSFIPLHSSSFLFICLFIPAHFHPHSFVFLFIPLYSFSFLAMPLHSSSFLAMHLHFPFIPLHLPFFLFIFSSLLLSCLIFIHCISLFVLHSAILCHVALLV